MLSLFHFQSVILKRKFFYKLVSNDKSAGAFSGFGEISIRTKISKIVSEDEVAKMFSLSSTIEALVKL